MFYIPYFNNIYFFNSSFTPHIMSKGFKVCLSMFLLQVIGVFLFISMLESKNYFIYCISYIFLFQIKLIILFLFFKSVNNMNLFGYYLKLLIWGSLNLLKITILNLKKYLKKLIKTLIDWYKIKVLIGKKISIRYTTIFLLFRIKFYRIIGISKRYLGYIPWGYNKSK